MDWVNRELQATGQDMLERLCSRLSYDIHQFNRLPDQIRWGVVAPRTFALLRYDHRQLAAVCWKSGDDNTPGRGHPILELQARDRDVRLSFVNNRDHVRPSLTIRFVPEAGEWEIVSAALESSTVSDLWKVSQEILRPFLFPRRAD